MARTARSGRSGGPCSGGRILYPFIPCHRHEGAEYFVSRRGLSYEVGNHKPERRIMRASLFAGFLLTCGLGLWGCGSAYGSGTVGNPSGPTQSSASGAGVVTINVVSINVA